MNLLDVRHVEISFGGVRALDDVSFSVREGGIFSIIGPNGAGKTTLFNVVTGMYRPDRGEIVLCGEDVTRLMPFQRAQRGLQRTFQNLQTFEGMTAVENVMVGFHLRQHSGFLPALLGLGIAATETAIARERAESLLDLLGLKAVRDTRAGELAYGQQKRLEIARALAAEPKVILLDEPAAGLNAMETDALAETIRMLARDGATIVLVEHDMRLVMGISDEVLVLNFGHQLAQGSPDEVANHPEVIEAYLGAEVA